MIYIRLGCGRRSQRRVNDFRACLCGCAKREEKVYQNVLQMPRLLRRQGRARGSPQYRLPLSINRTCFRLHLVRAGWDLLLVLVAMVGSASRASLRRAIQGLSLEQVVTR